MFVISNLRKTVKYVLYLFSPLSVFAIAHVDEHTLDFYSPS